MPKEPLFAESRLMPDTARVFVLFASAAYTANAVESAPSNDTFRLLPFPL